MVQYVILLQFITSLREDDHQVLDNTTNTITDSLGLVETCWERIWVITSGRYAPWKASESVCLYQLKCWSGLFSLGGLSLDQQYPRYLCNITPDMCSLHSSPFRSLCHSQWNLLTQNLTLLNGRIMSDFHLNNQLQEYEWKTEKTLWRYWEYWPVWWWAGANPDITGVLWYWRIRAV